MRKERAEKKAKKEEKKRLEQKEREKEKALEQQLENLKKLKTLHLIPLDLSDEQEAAMSWQQMLALFIKHTLKETISSVSEEA